MVLAWGWVLATAVPAVADPAGPTSFRTEIRGFVPAVDGVATTVVGGDSFIELSVDPGHAVEVIGYRGEPYLRFRPDGTVQRNRNAPSTYLNQDRYGNVAVPVSASAEAAPDWETVADDGRYAWHDHRTHWMSAIDPPGRHAGDTILEGFVPLVVDGAEVELRVAAIWAPTPSLVPVIVGAASGVALGLVGWIRRRTIPSLTALLAAVALTIAAIDYTSVPSETGPTPWLWLLPGIALLVATASAVGGGSSAPWRQVLQWVALVDLVLWSLLRWDWMWQPILPTNAPFWLDRMVTAAALSGSIALGVALLAAAVPSSQRFAEG